MKSLLFGLLVLSVMLLPAYAKATRYYGVDHHASFSTSCNTSRESANGTVEYEVMGIDCGPATGSYMILFVTRRFQVEPGDHVRSQEDHNMSQMVDVLAQNPNFASLKQVQPAEDDNWNGAHGRSAILKFISPSIIPGLANATGFAYFFADRSPTNVIYVTEVVTLFDASAQNAKPTLKTIKDLLRSVRFDAAK